MNKIMAAATLLLAIAALGASGCGGRSGERGAAGLEKAPPNSCNHLSGDEYIRCMSPPPVPRSCVPNGYGGFDCR